MNHVKSISRLRALATAQATAQATALAMTLAIALAGCGKADPELVAQQMTMTDATCAPAEIARIGDADVRKAFQARCDRRARLESADPAK